MSAEIRARIAEIDNILFAPSAYRNPEILATPSHRDRARFEAHIQERVRAEQRRQELIAERADLLAQLPPTGAASGQHMVLNRTLGTVYVRDSEPEPLRPDPNRDTDCPLRRAAAEFGWNFDD